MSELLMRVIEEICDDSPVTDVGVFLHSTVVVSKDVGLAYTFPKSPCIEPRDRHDVVANHGNLTDFSAKQLAGYSLSKELTEASIGVAAINSLVKPEASRRVMRNGVDILIEWSAGKSLAVVGHFPFVERIKPLVKDLWVLELAPRGDDLPASEACNIIPRADVIAMTGATLINHTLEGLLAMAKGKKVMVMGPSSILSPVLFDFGVHAICGVIVIEPERVIRELKEGGSFRGLRGVEFVTMLA